MPKTGQPPDDASSAPESGTVRDETSGNNPSPPDRGVGGVPKDDPSSANESK